MRHLLKGVGTNREGDRERERETERKLAHVTVSTAHEIKKVREHVDPHEDIGLFVFENPASRPADIRFPVLGIWY